MESITGTVESITLSPGRAMETWAITLRKRYGLFFLLPSADGAQLTIDGVEWPAESVLNWVLATPCKAKLWIMPETGNQCRQADLTSLPPDETKTTS